MKVDSRIFKAYDIRGIYPEQINRDIAFYLGKALVTFLNPRVIAVGRDVRLSSTEMSQELVKGITGSGVDVIDVGIISTDGLYFAVGKYGYSGGVMVTASHNPPEYNGFKICREDAIPLSGNEGLDEIREIILNKEYLDDETVGDVTIRNIDRDYIEHVLTFVDIGKIKPFKLVVDAGNGVAGKILPILFEHLKCEVIPMYFDLDGNFPNHLPSPIEPENTAELRKKVVDEGADLGVAFDGDADRMFLVDEKGNLVSGSDVTAIVAKSILKRDSDQTILYNAICSKSVPEMVRAMGGTPVLTPVGHALIKPIMREKAAIFGGEHSGHFYFRDNWFADSGLIAMMVALELLSHETKPLSEIVHEINPYYQSGEINSEVEDREAILAKVELHFEQQGYGANKLDGITVDLEDWWFNLRPSNTEPLVRLNVEAKTKELLDNNTEMLLKLIKED